MKWEVHALKVGQWDAIPGPELFWMSRWDEWTDMWLLAVLARSEDGRTALVNTGPPIDYLDYMNGLWRETVREDCQLRVAEDERIEAALAAHGVAPPDVDYVLCTPFQAYSVGNLPLFTNARICLSRKGWEFFFANPYPNHPHDFAPMVFPPRVLEHLVYEARERIHLLADEEELAPGLSVFWTGAHHRASIAVRFETSVGAVVASDSAFLYANVEEGKLLGINESMYEALDAYARFREADVFVPLYEKRVFERHPGGTVAR
jgi:glyoxylase-like metal-dependent hydrolase (beta-lactamase superfamily II)